MLMTVINFTRGILKNRKGQGMVEYGLIIGLIAVAVIVVLGLLGDEIAALFESVRATLAGTIGGS